MRSPAEPATVVPVPSAGISLPSEIAARKSSFTGLINSLNASASSPWAPLPLPVNQGIRNGTIYLEDFEDQALNTPFVSAPDHLGYFGTTVRARNPLSQIPISVDGDDGSIDGIVNLGDSWITINSSGFSGSPFKRFDFVPDELGRSPIYVGIVVTEVRTLSDDIDGGVRNAAGDNLFPGGEFDPFDWFPPEGALSGDASTHRYIGFYAEEGIATLLVNDVSQVDHLKYGYTIPEPSTALLSLPLLTRRRRPQPFR